MNDVVGLCYVCNSPALNLNACKACGARVCLEHYNALTGLCVNCEKGRRIN